MSRLRRRRERAEGLPAFGAVVFVEAGHRTVEHHQVGLAVAGQVHELRAAGQGEVGLGRNQLHRRKLRFDVRRAVAGFAVDRAEVALVEPGAGLLGQDAGDALAVQVGPLVGCAIQPDGQVLQAFGIHLLHRVLHDGLGVFELDRRQAALQIAVGLPFVAGLSDREQERVDGGARIVGVLLVGVGEVGGAHEAVVAHASFAIEMVEHQDALAQAVGAHLEAGAVGREGVGTAKPGVFMSPP